jgi:hypothetical protein
MLWNISKVTKEFNDIGQEVLIIDGFRNKNEILRCKITKTNLLIEMENYTYNYDESCAISVVNSGLVYRIEVGMGIHEGKVINMKQDPFVSAEEIKYFDGEEYMGLPKIVFGQWKGMINTNY